MTVWLVIFAGAFVATACSNCTRCASVAALALSFVWLFAVGRLLGDPDIHEPATFWMADFSALAIIGGGWIVGRILRLRRWARALR